MTQEHPITPPPELVQQWHNEWRDGTFIGLENYIATQAARWGADQELEACEKWVDYHCSKDLALDLRDARRPKPPSLKQQALEELNELLEIARPQGVFNTPNTIRRALEQLND